MGFFSKHLYFCLLLVVINFPALSVSQDNFVCSRATYYGSPDCKGNPTGACGYGDYGRTVNDAYVAGVSRLWKYGAGCGACYQVKCTKPGCTEDGVNVVVTDYGEGHYTDFVLSPRAYGKMAVPDKIHELYAYGVVDIEYRRVPCSFYGNKLVFKIHDRSKYPHYVAVVILYAPDKFDVLAVEMYQEDSKTWRPMRRAFGAVFDLENPPRGAVTLRFQVSSSAGVTWVQAANVNWESAIGNELNIELN